jgi:hypothetical protein
MLPPHILYRSSAQSAPLSTSRRIFVASESRHGGLSGKKRLLLVNCMDYSSLTQRAMAHCANPMLHPPDKRDFTEREEIASLISKNPAAAGF